MIGDSEKVFSLTERSGIDPSFFSSPGFRIIIHGNDLQLSYIFNLNYIFMKFRTGK